MNKKHQKYRIKSKVRFTISLVISLLILITVSSTLLGFDNVQGVTKETYKQIEVKNGDTLWTIAQKYMPKKMDTRQSVYLLSQINHTSAGDIYPGQTLNIPLEY